MEEQPDWLSPDWRSEAEQLLRQGIASSTSKVYTSAQKAFLEFCRRLQLTPLPASECTLILFVAELAQSHSHAMIRTYLVGVRHLHVSHGLGNPMEGALKLELVLKGARRKEPKQKTTRLPITPSILEKVKQVLDQSPGFNSTMLWAACCLGFFWLLALWRVHASRRNPL